MNQVKEIYSYREPHTLWLTIHLLTGKALHYKYDTAKDTAARIRVVLDKKKDFEKYDHYELSNKGEDKIIFKENEMPMLAKLDIDFVYPLNLQNACDAQDCKECNGMGIDMGGADCKECQGVGWN